MNVIVPLHWLPWSTTTSLRMRRYGCDGLVGPGEDRRIDWVNGVSWHCATCEPLAEIWWEVLWNRTSAKYVTATVRGDSLESICPLLSPLPTLILFKIRSWKTVFRHSCTEYCLELRSASSDYSMCARISKRTYCGTLSKLIWPMLIMRQQHLPV